MSKVGASLTQGAGVVLKSSLESATENFVLCKPAF